MPITYPDFQQGEERLSSDVPATRADVLTETFAQAFEENPIMAGIRWNELRVAQKTGPRLTAEAARERIADHGMQGMLTVDNAGITEAALSTLIERKRIEMRRADVFSRAQGGLAEGLQQFGISALTSLSDPISAGLNFVPVVGQARYANLLARASFLRRIGVRAGVGAAEGALGGALAEIPVAIMRNSEQADYGMADALLNVALGTVVGSGLHTTVGTAGEGIETFRARRSPIQKGSGLSYGERIIEMRAGRRVLNTDSAERAYAEIEGADGGRVLNTDLVRELSPDYQADRTLANAVHEPSSFLTKQLYARRLAEEPKAGEEAEVLFTAGGAGAGKSTALEMIEKSREGGRPQIIYDTNLDKLAGSVQKIEQALAAGKRVNIAYTYRDPVEALTKGALKRAMKKGRTVPLETHAQTHVGAAATIKALAEKYKDDPRVRIDVIDNSRGPGKQVLSSMEAIPALEYNRVREDLHQALEAEHAAGRISDAVYRGTLAGSGVSGQVRRAGSAHGRGAQAAPAGSRFQVLNETAAERAAVAPPQVREAALRASVGQAVTGDPVNVDAILNRGTAENAFTEALATNKGPGSTLDPEYAGARARAEEISESPTDADELLKAAQEEADLAVADAAAIAKRLEIEEEDPELAAADELVDTAERWAKAAEAATTCLLRGE